MASTQIGLNVTGKDSTRTAFDSVSNNIKKVASDVKSAAAKIDMKAGFNRIENQAKTAVAKIKQYFSGLGGVITSIFSGVSLKSLVDAGVESERKWTNIAANVGMTIKDMGVYKKELFDIAQKWGVSNSELSGGVQVIAQKYGDIGKAMSYANGLAATSQRMQLSSAEIAEALFKAEMGQTRALKGKVLTVDQYNRFLADGKITEEEIGLVMKENELVAQGMTDTAAAGMAKMENATSKLKTSIGLALLPAVEKLAGWVQKIADWYNDLNPQVKEFAAYLTAGALAATAIGAPLAIIAPILTGMVGTVAKIATSMWSYVAAARAGSTITPKLGASVGGIPLGTAAFTVALGVITAVAAWKVADEVINSLDKFFYEKSTKEKEAMTEEEKRQQMTKKGKELDAQAWGGLTSAIDTAKQNLGSFGDTWGQISSKAGGAIGSINTEWGGLKTYVGKGVSGTVKVVQEGWNGALATARNLYDYVRRGAQGVVRVITSGIQSAWSSIQGLYNTVRQGATGVVTTVRQFIGMGPAGAAGPAGPLDDMNFHYESYAGSKKDAWRGTNNMSGNCVDMTQGLINRYGGSMVQGTWNGGDHVWWRAPNGKEFDPARKALNNTFRPPSRGPGDGMGSNIIIQGDVYGFDDFAKKVEQANNKIVVGVF